MLFACASFALVSVVYAHDVQNEIIAVAIAAASLISSVAGFAFSPIAGAILFHLDLNPVRVVEIMITCSIFNQLLMTWGIRRDIDWRALSVHLAGGIPGIIVGVSILTHVDSFLYKPVFGGLLLLYSAYMLFRPVITIRHSSTAADLLVAFASGITAGVAGFPGGPTVIWCSLRGWSKERQRGLVQPFILIMQVITLTAIGLTMHRIGGVAIEPASVLFVAVSLLATSVGFAFFRRLTDRQFARWVNLLLLLSGLSFVI
jgi:uncharacterized membrane protein YfcA